MPSTADAGAEGGHRVPILCARCGVVLTFRDQRREVDGAHEHTFFNPAGVVFTIACFRSADGASFGGDAEAAFSWFPGWSWRIASCQACGAHVGWRWEAGDSAFFGLVTTALRTG